MSLYTLKQSLKEYYDCVVNQLNDIVDKKISIKNNVDKQRVPDIVTKNLDALGSDKETINLATKCACASGGLIMLGGDYPTITNPIFSAIAMPKLKDNTVKLAKIVDNIVEKNKPIAEDEARQFLDLWMFLSGGYLTTILVNTALNTSDASSLYAGMQNRLISEPMFNWIRNRYKISYQEIVKMRVNLIAKLILSLELFDAVADLDAAKDWLEGFISANLPKPKILIPAGDRPKIGYFASLCRL